MGMYNEMLIFVAVIDGSILGFVSEDVLRRICSGRLTEQKAAFPEIGKWNRSDSTFFLQIGGGAIRGFPLPCEATNYSMHGFVLDSIIPSSY